MLLQKSLSFLSRRTVDYCLSLIFILTGARALLWINCNAVFQGLLQFCHMEYFCQPFSHEITHIYHFIQFEAMQQLLLNSNSSLHTNLTGPSSHFRCLKLKPRLSISLTAPDNHCKSSSSAVLGRFAALLFQAMGENCPRSQVRTESL